MYWIWTNERADDNEARIGGVPEAIEAADLRFDRGTAITKNVPLIDIVRDEDAQGRLTDNLIAPGVRGLTFSSRLRTVLANVGVDNIDYYPCRVISNDGTAPNENYQVANLIGRVACVDLTASDVEMDPDDPGAIEYVNSLTLDETAIGGALMFRLKEHAQVIVVDERVKTACERENITGIRFYAPSDFSM